jgi:hypothetical protein
MRGGEGVPPHFVNTFEPHMTTPLRKRIDYDNRYADNDNEPKKSKPPTYSVPTEVKCAHEALCGLQIQT